MNKRELMFEKMIYTGVSMTLQEEKGGDEHAKR